MKKIYVLLGSLFITNYAFSQVGVNTATPSTSFDVSVKKNGTAIDNTQTYGLQAPRLTKAELITVSGTNTTTPKYGTDQKGAIVYITDIAGTDTGGTSGQRANITAEGYYYFDGSIWQAIKVNTPNIWNSFVTQLPGASNTTGHIYRPGKVSMGFNVTESTIGTTGQFFHNVNAFEHIGIYRYGTDNPTLALVSARGTLDNPEGLLANDGLGRIIFEGRNSGGTRTEAASIRAISGTDLKASADGSGSLEFLTRNNGNYDPRMTIIANGNVGIGSTSPVQKLDVNGNIKTKAITNGDVVFNTSDLGLYGATNNWVRIATRGADNGTSGTSKIAFYTNATADDPVGVGTTPALVVSNGKVGINLTSTATSHPGNNLEIVNGTDGNSGLRLTNLKNGTILATDDKGDVISKDGSVFNSAWNNKHTSNNANTVSASAYRTGYVGIGDFSTSTNRGDINRALTIAGTGGANDDIRVESVSSDTSSGMLGFQKSRGDYQTKISVVNGDKLGELTFDGHNGSSYSTLSAITAQAESGTKANLRFATSGTERVRITGDGDVGIGVAIPSQKLEVNGSIKATAITNGGVNLNTSDLGLYGTTNNWIRIATRGADNGASGTSKIAFYTNATTTNPTGVGTKPAMVIANGKVGINIESSGSNLPNANLHVAGNNSYEAIQIQDGSQGEGKFLSSDRNGRATWVTSPLTPISQGDTDDSSESTAYIVNDNMYLKKKITLTKGRWMIYVGNLFNSPGSSEANNKWIRLTLSSASGSQSETGFKFLSSKLVSGWLSTVGSSYPIAEQYTFLSGVIPIEVTNNNATIYLRTRESINKGTIEVLARSNYAENYLFAIPAY